MTTEFSLIREVFQQQVDAKHNLATNVILGIGDDAALQTIPPGMELATSIDTLIAGVHFPADTPPADIGHKALAVSLSDISAMGAQPITALLTLTLPEADQHWLKQFAQGFFALANAHQVQLIGGDTTRGPLSITTVVSGWVPAGKALRRDAAQAGDLIYVSGTLGDAGAALQQWQDGKLIDPVLLSRFNRPTPQVALGQALRGVAHAAIDISDGLVSDLGHIAAASQVGAVIHAEQCPQSVALKAVVPAHEQACRLALAAGDDYELCFTAPRCRQALVSDVARECAVAISCIGEVVVGQGVVVYDHDGKLMPVEKTGFSHF